MCCYCYMLFLSEYLWIPHGLILLWCFSGSTCGINLAHTPHNILKIQTSLNEIRYSFHKFTCNIACRQTRDLQYESSNLPVSCKNNEFQSMYEMVISQNKSNAKYYIGISFTFIYSKYVKIIQHIRKRSSNLPNLLSWRMTWGNHMQSWPGSLFDLLESTTSLLNATMTIYDFFAYVMFDVDICWLSIWITRDWYCHSTRLSVATKDPNLSLSKHGSHGRVRFCRCFNVQELSGVKLHFCDQYSISQLLKLNWTTLVANSAYSTVVSLSCHERLPGNSSGVGCGGH